jgi:FkbM family methyltransferase
MLGQLLKAAARNAALYALGPTGQFDITWKRLKALSGRGLKVQMAVDGGASTGTWTRHLKQLYPEAQVLCVEPRQACQPALKELAARYQGIHVAQTLLGDHAGTVTFSEHGAQSSIFPNSQGKTFGSVQQLPMVPLDQLIERLQLPFPELIKLDLQGADLACLKGSPKCLAGKPAVLMEVLFLAIYRGMPLADEVVEFMSEHGYCCHDILSLWHRPLDGALAFGDFLFLPRDHRFRQDARWALDAGWES